MKLICIGDSLTFGYGVAKGERWTSLVGMAKGIEVINKGVNGDTTAGMLSRSYKDIILNKPSHVIIMGGTNDFLTGISPYRVAENIEEFLREAENYGIDAIIGIAPPVNASMAVLHWAYGIDYERVNKDIETYREWVIDYCSNHNLVYIDFYTRFKNLIDDENAGVFYVDGIHFTAKGHTIMAEKVNSKIKKSVLYF